MGFGDAEKPVGRQLRRKLNDRAESRNHEECDEEWKRPGPLRRDHELALADFEHEVDRDRDSHAQVSHQKELVLAAASQDLAAEPEDRPGLGRARQMPRYASVA